MEHSAIIKKGYPVTVFSYTEVTDPDIEVYKLAEDNSFTTVNDIFTVLQLQTNYYKTTFNTPDEDCFLCMNFGGYPTFIRVGEPSVKLLHYSGQTSENISFKQINPDNGMNITTGQMIEAGNGFYHATPLNTSFSILEIQNEDGFVDPNVLKLPYTTTSTSTSGASGGPGYTAVENFLNTGYNTIAFLGNEYSEYDYDNGRWIESVRRVKSADMAKAVCYKYNKEWSLTVPRALAATLQPEWIGNYIKYIKTQDENQGRSISYIPAVTPDSHAYNFDVVTEDELGNTQLKGLMIMLNQPMETLGTGEDGIIFNFRDS